MADAASRIPAKEVLTFLDAGDWSAGDFKDACNRLRSDYLSCEQEWHEDFAGLGFTGQGTSNLAPLQQLAAALFGAVPAKPVLSGLSLPSGVTQEMARAYAMVARCQSRCHAQGGLRVDHAQHVLRASHLHGAKIKFTNAPKEEVLRKMYDGEKDMLEFGDRRFAIVRLWSDYDGLRESDVKVFLHPDAWKPPEEVEACAAYFAGLAKEAGRKAFPGLNARLRGWEFKDGRLQLELQQSGYWHFLATNANADETRPTGQTARQMYEPGPQLVPLAESKMCNELGMNCLVETSDQVLFVVQRSKSVTGTNFGMGPSVSGGVRWATVAEEGGSPFRAVREELERELGIVGPDIQDLRLVSLTRGLGWAGHPSVRFLARIRQDAESLVHRFKQGTEEDYEIHRGLLRQWDGRNLATLKKKIVDPTTTAPVAATVAHYVWNKDYSSRPAR